MLELVMVAEEIGEVDRIFRSCLILVFWCATFFVPGVPL